MNNPYVPKKKSCVWCFNLKLKSGLACCKVNHWSKIFILDMFFAGEAGALRQELVRKAKNCKSFSGEDFLIRREFKEKYSGARVSISPSVKKVEEVGVSIKPENPGGCG